jgi:hypothetical protein
VRPLFVTAAGMPAADAAHLVRRMADRYRLPNALRRAGTLAREGPSAAAITDRQLADRRRRAERGRSVRPIRACSAQGSGAFREYPFLS